MTLRLWQCLTPFTTFPDERVQRELDKIEEGRAIAERSKGEDLAIAELLEPLLKNQRARDYADLLQPPFVQKPLLNNHWAGLAEKVWSKFEVIVFFLVIIRLFTSENYLEANVDKEDTKAIWKVCLKAFKASSAQNVASSVLT